MKISPIVACAMALALSGTGCKRKVVVESLVPVPSAAPVNAGAPQANRAINASSADREGVLAAAQGVLDAINTRDTARVRALLVPGMVLVSVRDDTGAPAPPRTQTAAAFITQLGQNDGQVLLERMWTPTVRIDGGIATVAAPYDFYINGTRSHCGTDVFTVIRTNAGWKVAGLSYTVQMNGCPSSPLGAPKK